MEDASRHLSGTDVGLLYGYFVVVIGVVWISSRMSSKRTRGGEHGDAYFLADHSVGALAVSASLFASNIGAEHFVGLAGTAAYSGIAVGFYEWGAMICLLLLGYTYLPVYLLADVATTPEYLQGRYNDTCKMVLVGVSLLLYVFTKISATLYAGQLILEQVTNVNPWLSAVLLILGTAVYTMLGGLAAVIYTEALQTLVLLAGGFMLFGITMDRIGGLDGLRRRSQIVGGDYMRIFRSASDEQFPWTGFAFGYYWVALWYWCCDQVIVQRGLAARGVSHGRLGCVLGGILKVVPGFIIVLPGMVARVLMQEGGIVDNQTDRQQYDRAFGWLVMNVVPTNLRGLLIAGMISALMSSLASVFNSSSTLFTLDVYKRWRPCAEEKELVWVGRLSVAIIALLSLLWLPVIPMLGDQLFLYVQKPPAYIAPPILAVYTWGMLTNFVNAEGATVALGVGITLGVLRFLLEIGLEISWVPAHFVPYLYPFVGIHFLHFAFINFMFASATLFAWSWIVGQGDTSTDYKDYLFSFDIVNVLHAKESAINLHDIAGNEDEDEVELSCTTGSPRLGEVELEHHVHEGEKEVISDTCNLLTEGSQSDDLGILVGPESNGKVFTFFKGLYERVYHRIEYNSDGQRGCSRCFGWLRENQWFTNLRQSDFLFLDLAAHACSAALLALFVFVLVYFE